MTRLAAGGRLRRISNQPSRPGPFQLSAWASRVSRPVTVTVTPVPCPLPHVNDAVHQDK